MIDDFLIRALIIGTSISLASGVLGCFVVWKKMAYFGDSLAHNSLLGLVLGLSFGFSIPISVLLVCLLFVLLLLWFQHVKLLATDTLLGIMAHAGLAMGIVGLSLSNISVNLHGILFGNILTATWDNIYITLVVVVVILSILILYWQKFLLIVVHEELAKAEGVNTVFYNILFMLLISLLVAVSMQVIGVLLITSLLIIPAASVRALSTSPIKMALSSILVSLCGFMIGVFSSSEYDIPLGPAVVLALFALFFCSVILQAVNKR